ncbi:glucose 1-dehydrogenase [Arthrobacter sp. JSM 101049]|uniref:glucose 1-dehydrogenase n=1 Tax=Arthrobacter sp. JSM 101049 TaxID=929097 RepID=UPI00356184F2
MKALSLTPGTKDSLSLQDVDAPEESQGSVLVEALSIGLCGTDKEILNAEYGTAPEGKDRLVIGHENLGRVKEAPDDSGFSAGDLVVGIVRRPDPVPCAACAVGEWDMCLNGKYTEHGIKSLDGFAREQWRGDPEDMVKLDSSLAEVGVLLEPTTIVAKAWEQIERIGSRAFFDPHVVAVTGAGPVGLLAALLGVQRGYEVHVFDIVDEGPKPGLVKDLGATFHTDSLPDSGLEPEIIVECTGVPSVIVDAIANNGKNAVVCLTGVSSSGKQTPLDVGAMNRTAVLENDVVFGTVNANRRHYEQGAEALAKADADWLGRLITRRHPMKDYATAFEHRDGDVKVVIDVAKP